MKNQTGLWATVVALSLCYFSCKHDKKTHEDKHAEPKFTYHDVKSAKFPSLNIPGFKFPEDSTKINNWIHTKTNDSLYLHSWGIWTGLTSKTQQTPEGHSALRVFETWLTPEEMIDSIKGLPVNRSNRANLKRPRQLTHFASNLETVNDSIHESVSYSPGAAKFAIDNKIFLATTLYKYGALEHKVEIPVFPTNAITIKPVFKLLQTSSGATSFNIAAWHGTTDKLVAFPEQDWGTFVTVNTKNEGPSEGSTFHLNDFIHYKLNAEDAHFFNKEFTENSGNAFNAQPGDTAILVGMHVSSREIANWTWQTFWWTPDADNPPLPSSKAIANMRPNALKGAARHYAMAVAYYMVNPNEPYSGENITGEPNYAFNPYLEAGFGPDTFNDSLSFVQTTTKKIPTYVGVRTNCMSCHRMASVNPSALNTKINSKTPYVGNAFISKTDTIFNKQLLLDFAWSIQGNVDTTGIKAFINKHQTTH